jgi:DNA-binding response OmpR family regulator
LNDIYHHGRASPFFDIFTTVASVTCGCIFRQVFTQERFIYMASWKTNVDTIPLHTDLIASDRPEDISSWENLFQQRNCIVLTESTVSATLQTARLVGPSLMLVDMSLSKQKRNAMLKELRLTSRGPILLLISANTVDEVLEANQAGADECLVKPVNPAVLIVKAMAWLGHGQRKRTRTTGTGPLNLNPAH